MMYIMDIMDIMEIIDIMNIMNTTAWMAMAGAVLALVVLGSQLPEERYHQIQQHLPSLTLQPYHSIIKYYMSKHRKSCE